MSFSAVSDPRGRNWEVKGISKFVKAHPELFDPEDISPRGNRPCNAQIALTRVVGNQKHSVVSWKGWTRGTTAPDRVIPAEPVERPRASTADILRLPAAQTTEADCDKFYALGGVVEIERLGTVFAARSGAAYAARQDGAAQIFRTLSEEFEAEGKKMRAKYMQKYHPEPLTIEA